MSDTFRIGDMLALRNLENYNPFMMCRVTGPNRVCLISVPRGESYSYNVHQVQDDMHITPEAIDGMCHQGWWTVFYKHD